MPIAEGTAALIGAGLSAAGAVGSSALSANAANVNSHQGRVYARWALHEQQKENELARQWQHGESALARQWEEEMYNQYNSPSAMMRQYKEAGLNPYLVGQDPVGSGMSSSAPMSGAGASGLSPGTPPQFMPDFSPIAGIGRDVMQAFGIHAQIANQEAQAKEKLWSTAADIYYKFGYKDFKQFADQNGLFHKDSGSSMFEQLITGQIMKENQESYHLQVQSSLIENYEKPKAEKMIEQLDKILSQMDQQIELLKSQKNLTDKEAYRVGSEIARNLAAAGLDKAVAAQYSALLNLVKSKAAVDLGMSSMDFLSQFAEFSGDEEVRDYMSSQEGKDRRLWNYLNSPEGNAVLSIMRGLRDNLPNISPYIKRPSSMTINPGWNVGTPWMK